MATITTKKTKQDVLIEVFHTVQEAFGCLWEDLLMYTGHPSKLSLRWAYIPVQVLNRDGELVDEVIRD